MGLSALNSNHSPRATGASAISEHIFRMSVLTDGAGGRALAAEGDDEEAPADFVDTRAAADRVHDGRRWLAGFLQMWRLIEVGAPAPEPLARET